LRVTLDPDLATLKAKLKEAKAEPQQFVKPQAFLHEWVSLWENLIALYLQPVDSELREEVIKRLRWFWIIDRLARQDSSLKTVEDVRAASRASVLIPEQILPPNLATEPAPPPREDNSGRSRSDIQTIG